MMRCDNRKQPLSVSVSVSVSININSTLLWELLVLAIEGLLFARIIIVNNMVQGEQATRWVKRMAWAQPNSTKQRPKMAQRGMQGMI
jgi:hypothetical protein